MNKKIKKAIDEYFEEKKENACTIIGILCLVGLGLATLCTCAIEQLGFIVFFSGLVNIVFGIIVWMAYSGN
jgi:hypothetical protein